MTENLVRAVSEDEIMQLMLRNSAELARLRRDQAKADLTSGDGWLDHVRSLDKMRKRSAQLTEANRKLARRLKLEFPLLEIIGAVALKVR